MRTWAFVLWAVACHAQDCNIEDLGKQFDCFPEGGMTMEECQARKCCWVPSPDQSATRCYFSKDFDGFKVLNQTQTSNGLTIFLERGRPSGIARDVKVLRVDVIQQADDIARISIVDPSNKRWQPPLPAIPAPKKSSAPKYKVSLTSNKRLEVTRSGSSGAAIVSLDLATMVYTDKFLSITNRLSSDIVYGIGELKGTLRRSFNYSKITLHNKDRLPIDYKNIYGTQPFYLNIEQDGQSNGVWFFNSNSMDIFLQPNPAITYRTTGGILDFFVFVGPTATQVVQSYQEMVGKPAMVPYWSLGFHLCRYGYGSTQNTSEIYKKNIDAGVRLEVQWNDIDYMDRRNDFTLDPVKYKDHGKFVDEIHKSGRRFVMIVDPAVSGGEKPGTYPAYDRGVELDVFVKDINGKIAPGRVWNEISSIFPDFTNPNATLYWTELFSEFYKLVEYDGAWIDMNEPSNLVTGHVNEGCPNDLTIPYTPGDENLHTKTLCSSDQHYWTSHYNMHNMYGFTESIATYNALKTIRQNKRPFIISRSTFSGQGAYTGHWTGDIRSNWDQMKSTIPGILAFSLFGVPMVGSDICGFVADTNDELCMRWSALGAFYPFSRNHNDINTIAQDPASMGGKVLASHKESHYWRYKLLPYMYTCFYNAHTNGATVATPLFLEFPKDFATHNIEDQFMFGDSILVVPVLNEKQTKVKAYFPSAIWYDIQNASKPIDTRKAGKEIEIDALETSINFYMRGGRIVPFQEPEATTDESRKNPFGLYVFLDSDKASGDLFIDDGESVDSIEKKAYTYSTFNFKCESATSCCLESKIQGQKAKNVIDTIHIYGMSKKIVDVSIGGKSLKSFVVDASKNLVTLYGINKAPQDLSIKINVK